MKTIQINISCSKVDYWRLLTWCDNHGIKVSEVTVDRVTTALPTGMKAADLSEEYDKEASRKKIEEAEVKTKK